MSGNKMKNLKTFLDRFKNRVEALKASENASQDQDEIDGIEELMKNIEDQIEDIDAEMEDDEELNSQKPLIDKLSENKNDFNIIKNKFNQKKEEIKSAHAKELLFTGQLKGSDKRKAERDVALDQVKEVDEQGQMLDSIHENVKGANANLENMNVEAKKQGEQIDRIGDKVITMDNTVKKTGNVMSDIERRICCRKCMIWVAIILVILMNIIMAFLIFAKMFGWPGFSKGSDESTDKPTDKPTDPTETTDDSTDEPTNKPTLINIKGIVYDDYGKNIKFEDFSGKNLDFVMLLGGEEEVVKPDFKTTYDKAITNGVKVGMIWKIKTDNKNSAFEQVNKASSYLGKSNLNLNYHFYFEIDSNILNDYQEADKYCKNITKTCGIILSQEVYNTNYKTNFNNIKDIDYYWITSPSQQFKPDEESKVALWDLGEDSDIDGNKYKSIKAKNN